MGKDYEGGEIEYTIRADDSYIESDLNKAHKKVEKAAKESAEKVEKIEADKTKNIKSETDKVVKNSEKAAKDVENAWQSIDGDVDIHTNAKTEKAESKIKSISKDRSLDVKMDADNSGAKKAIEELEDVGEEVSGSLKDKLSEALSGDALSEIGNSLLGGLDSILGSAGGKFAGLGSGLTSALGGLGGLSSVLPVAAIAGIGTALVGVGTAAVNVADDMKGAMNTFLASTGTAREETERYQTILEDIYNNNYGDSFEDIANAMASVKKNLGDLDDATLQEITESAFALRDTFEYDVTESTRAAKAMMDNFGISGEQAMSMIAAGAQNGLDYSGELIDSINEYSVQFAKMGLDADDMFKIFQKGAESGAFNLDKIGDAVKEMSIRVVDGSDTTREGFKLLGLDADEMARKFAAGGETAKEAFNETIKALANMEDPIAQNTAGVNILGTMWEDLGADAVTALADIEEGAYDTEEAMNGIKEVKYDSLGDMFQALKRNVETLLIPIGEALMPLLECFLESGLEMVEELLVPLIELTAEFLGPLIELISKGIGPLSEAFIFLIESAMWPLMETADLLRTFFTETIFDMAEKVGEGIQRIREFFQGIIDFFKGQFLERIRETVSSVRGHFDNVKQIFQSIIDFVRNVFSGNWKAAWQNVKDIFANIVQGFAGIFKSPINSIIDGINSFIRGLNKIKIPSWVPGVGGKGFSIKTIPRLKVGMEYVPSDYFPAFLDEGEAVLTREENVMYRALGGVEGMLALSRGYQDIRESQTQTSTIVVHTHVDMDGREVARGVSEFVGEQLPWEEL